MSPRRSYAEEGALQSSQASASTSSSHQDDRQDRSIRPLGSSRRPGRSRTPTPSNPNPNVAVTLTSSPSPSLAAPTRQGAAQDSLSSPPPPLPPPIFSRSNPGRSATATTTRSTSTQGQSERRPWFPYPSPHPSNTNSSQQRSSSSSHRRISNISTGSSNSASSASSYNSEDIDTRLGNSSHNRRAVSAEPEQRSHSIARGRPLHMSNAVHQAGDSDSASTAKLVEVEEHDSSSSSSEEEKERAHFKSVLRSFDAYLSHSLAANNARRRSFYSLPRSHRLLLSSLGSPLPTPILPTENGREEPDEASLLGAAGRGFKARLDEIDDRIRRNADVLSQIVDDSRSFLGEEKEEKPPVEDTSRKVERGDSPEKAKADGEVQADGKAQGDGRGSSADTAKVKKGRTSYPRIPDHDLDKVRSTIKQYVRDWSLEGLSEREAAYDPILEALESCFKHISSAQRSQLRVLVPGAGLGRLAFEIAWLGFSCQGNEFSFYMLLASHFILNKTVQVNQHVIYPFIHSSSNWRTADDMLCAIQIPDINPTDLPSHVDFSMVAGEFIEVYSKEQERAAWDAVTTCFFIDTAHNLTRYLEVINHALVLGGVWINVGPLLWHYEGAAHGDLSIELTLDEVLGLVGLLGFHIEVQRTLPPQCYTGNKGSMLSYKYSPEFWVARKIREVAPAKVY